ncbi:diacylglycerol kinase [Oceanispirochaeta sp.]|uniref:diacylglycerol kinase n=1 Tax=Oceanispirochaeta sp. TaxID=2035350 RepID=UPI00261A7375|nr:diacylglycerol kinase family protein [Oceanispirochaeta sp.]MDA3957349.1 diacylglycerol kinase family protein [Oceanispirochaeta sp.]
MKIINRVIKKLNYAFKGLRIAAITDNSFKIHFVFALPIVISGFFLEFNQFEWVTISISIGIVLISELFNTAIEYIVKMFTCEYHELAEKLLDISAGAVLMSSILAVVLALLIYIPHFR